MRKTKKETIDLTSHQMLDKRFHLKKLKKSEVKGKKKKKRMRRQDCKSNAFFTSTRRIAAHLRPAATQLQSALAQTLSEASKKVNATSKVLRSDWGISWYIEQAVQRQLAEFFCLQIQGRFRFRRRQLHERAVCHSQSKQVSAKQKRNWTHTWPHARCYQI